MRKKVFFFIVLVIFWGCGKQEITIGFIANITGKSSNLAIDARDAVVMGIEEINAQGGIKGKKIHLIIENDGFDKEKAVQGIKNLIAQKPVVIIGHIMSAMSIATIPLINENKILMISPTTVTNELNEKDDYFLRISPPNGYVLKLFAQKIKESKIQEVNVVYDLINKNYSEDWHNTFKKELEALGGKVFSFPFHSDNEKITKEFAKKIANKTVIIVSSPLIAGTLTQYIRQISSVKIFCAGWAMGPEFLEHAGKYGEGVIFSYNFDEYTQNPLYLEFKEKFFKKYGRNPSFTATYGYQTVLIIRDALMNTERYDADSLKKYILTKKVFDSLQDEKIEFDAFGDPKPVAIFIQIKDGRFVKGVF